MSGIVAVCFIGQQCYVLQTEKPFLLPVMNLHYRKMKDLLQGLPLWKEEEKKLIIQEMDHQISKIPPPERKDPVKEIIKVGTKIITGESENDETGEIKYSEAAERVRKHLRRMGR